MEIRQIQDKSQIPACPAGRPNPKSQINPVTDEMKNNYVNNGVNPNFQTPKFQTRKFRSLVIWLLVIIWNLVLGTWNFLYHESVILL